MFLRRVCIAFGFEHAQRGDEFVAGIARVRLGMFGPLTGCFFCKGPGLVRGALLKASHRSPSALRALFNSTTTGGKSSVTAIQTWSRSMSKYA